MKHITNVTDLLVGREYWLLDKKNGSVAISKLKVEKDDRPDKDRPYFENRMWAFPSNNQAMQHWDIFGPLPVRVAPDFDALMRGETDTAFDRASIQHANIVNIPCNVAEEFAGNAETNMAYKVGHRDARHAAAALALSCFSSNSDLSVLQEPKYGVGDNGIYNRASLEFIPPYEPIFIFRGKDITAVSVLDYYQALCVIPEHKKAVSLRIRAFEDFAARYPEQMKRPDTDVNHIALLKNEGFL